MTDTQWPRFEVFVQDRPDRPHQHAGSVHAPDAELALLNARDVFVRRPECVSLWLAPSAAIRSRTAQELEVMAGRPGGESGRSAPAPDRQAQVFAKLDQRGTLVHLGELSLAEDENDRWAAAAGMAEGAALVIWIVPAEAILRSEPDQVDSLFSPAAGKPFRDQAYYRVYTALRNLREESRP